MEKKQPVNNKKAPMPNKLPPQPQGPTKEEVRRVEDCMEALKAVLGEYRVTLIPLITLGPNGVVNSTIQGHAIPEERRIIVPNIDAKKIVDEIAEDNAKKGN
jgi:hypothetical protein